MVAGLVTGYIRYLLATPLTVVGAISMYIYGGFWVAVYSALPHLFAGAYIRSVMAYFLNEALPPTSFEQILFQIVLGTFMAGTKWLAAMMFRA